MKLICDTNIILDVVLRREPFYSYSAQCLNMCESGDCEGVITTNSLTDIFYVVHRITHSNPIAYDAIEMTAQIFSRANTDDECIRNALAKRHRDFEDSIIAYAAEKNGCDYILTRNKKDYANFSIPAISPKELLDLFP